MSKAIEKPTAPRKPDGTLTTRINNQIFIIEVFFNHDSKETFQDKLLRVILADGGEPMTGTIPLTQSGI